MSQEQLAAAARTSQTTIEKIENGKSLRSRFLPAVFRVLELPLEAIDNDAPIPSSISPPRPPLKIIPGADLVGERDFPIYAAAQGGSGHLIVTFDPVETVKRPAILEGVRGAYGLLVVGDSMEPAYRHGDMALVNPGRPPGRGDDVVLYDHPPDGEAEAIIKTLVGWTEKEWLLKQYNPPKEWRELKADWTTAHLVVGCYRRR